MDLSNERMWELYKLNCERRGIEAKLDDYVKWMNDLYPEEEPYDLYLEWVDGEPYIDNVRINMDLKDNYEPSERPF